MDGNQQFDEIEHKDWGLWLKGYMTSLNEQLKKVMPFMRYPMEFTDLTPEGQDQVRGSFLSQYRDKSKQGDKTDTKPKPKFRCLKVQVLELATTAQNKLKFFQAPEEVRQAIDILKLLAVDKAELVE
jgi:hypothetical protein